MKVNDKSVYLDNGIIIEFSSNFLNNVSSIKEIISSSQWLTRFKNLESQSLNDLGTKELNDLIDAIFDHPMYFININGKTITLHSYSGGVCVCEIKRDENMKNVGILFSSDGAIYPHYSTDNSSGADVYSTIDITLKCGDRTLVPTGVSMDIPDGYEVQVRPRSGLALKYGITVLNTPGTIDSDYTGEIGIILINHGNEDYIIRKGDKIAQLVLNKVYKMNFIKVDELKNTVRGKNGFGSTGN